MNASNLNQDQAVLITSLSDAGSDSDPLRSVTEERISRRSDYEQRTKTYRNMLCAISKLPPETLCRIFRLCAPTPYNQCLGPSQVCTQWRALTLNDPIFWRTPVLRCPRLALEMVERAKNVPLILDAGIGLLREQSRLDAIEFALKSNPIECLIFGTNEPRRLERFMQLIVEKSRHTLRFLRLASKTTRNFILPDDSSWQFPELRVLHLECCTPFPWNPARFSRLVTINLSLFSQRVAKEVLIDLDTLFELLRNNPDLESLTLTTAIKHTTVPSISPRKIRLERLRCLQLTDTLSCLLRVLPLLDLPSICDLRTNMLIVDVTGENEVDSLIYAILDKFSHLPADYRDVRRLQYSVGAPSSVSITAIFHTNEAQRTSNDSYVSERSCRIVLNLPRTSPNWDHWSGILPNFFSLRRVQELCVVCSDHKNDNSLHLRPLWKLKSLQNTLTSVIVERDILSSLLEVLVEDSSLTDSERQRVFPLLEELVIENAMITDVADVPVTSDDDEQPNADTPSSVDGVLRLLKTWTVRSNKTLRLSLLGCSVPLPGYRDAFRSVNIVLEVALGRVVIPAATALSIPTDILALLRDNGCV